MGKAPKTGRERHPFFQQEYALQLEMVRPSKQLLEVPPTPPGYLLPQFRPGDEEEYDVLFHMAFEDRSNDPKSVHPWFDIRGRAANHRNRWPSKCGQVDAVQSPGRVATCDRRR